MDRIDIAIPILAPVNEQTPAIPELTPTEEGLLAKPVKNNLPAELTPFLGEKLAGTVLRHLGAVEASGEAADSVDQTQS